MKCSSTEYAACNVQAHLTAVETWHVTSRCLLSKQHSSEALGDSVYSSEAGIESCMDGLAMMCAGTKVVLLADRVQSLRARRYD